MSDVRDKTLEDFRDVLRWLESNELDVTVIGGMAVGKFAAERGISSLSGDLDLLVSPEDQAKFESLAKLEPRAEIRKRPQPRNLSVLVVEWGSLEIDVLTESDGLSSPSEVRKRAWSIEGVSIADPVDLLSIKLAMRREKDLPHIEVLRTVCAGFAAYFFETEPGRGAFEFLSRLCDAEQWSGLPAPLFDELLARAANSSSEGRRFLVGHAPSRAAAASVVESAPAQEQAMLRTILDKQVLQ